MIRSSGSRHANEGRLIIIPARLEGKVGIGTKRFVLSSMQLDFDEVQALECTPHPPYFLLHFYTNLETQLFGPKTAEFRVSAEKSHLCIMYSR